LDPVAYEPAKPGKPAGKVMIQLPIDRDNPSDQAKLKVARHREFIFGRSDGTDEAPWTIKTDGGFGYNMDPRRISAAPQLANGPTNAGVSGDGTLEVWKIVNGGNGWNHPVHVHFEEGIILSRDGKAPPEWEKGARKDVYRIGEGIDSSVDVEVALHFREFAGTYMEHCHNTQHEDTSMLLRWDVEHPGQFQLMPTSLPGWDGVTYVNSVALPTFRTGNDNGDHEGKNKNPVANPDSATSNNGLPLAINVLANDTDPDGNLPLKVAGLSQPGSGRGTVSTDGIRVVYTPPAIVAAPFTATFTYDASDKLGAVSKKTGDRVRDSQRGGGANSGALKGDRLALGLIHRAVPLGGPHACYCSGATIRNLMLMSSETAVSAHSPSPILKSLRLSVNWPSKIPMAFTDFRRTGTFTTRVIPLSVSLPVIE
jgi:hypothetical protein